MKHIACSLGIAAALAACGGENGSDDAGRAGLDSGASDGGGTADAGRAALDAGGGDDAGSVDAAVACAPGVECANYAAALAAAPRGATSLDNCVIQMHRADCCGAMRAYGANHAARTDLCPAEDECVAMYPSPASCTDDTITTDTGDTTNVMADVKLRIVDPTPCDFDPATTCYTCETFVCTDDTCRAAPGIAGGCG